MIKELEDYNWFPGLFRRFQVEYIGSVVRWLNIYKPVVPLYREMVEKNKPLYIQDLCSGSGAPLLYLASHIDAGIKIVLSDKFPDNHFTDSDKVVYKKDPVDALSFTPGHGVMYTQFNALHHFEDGDKRRLAGKLCESGNPFLFVEITEPGLVSMVKILFTTLVLQLLTAPLVKPFSLLRLFFTYLIPVNLFTVTYDGIISVMKSRTVQQYKQLFGRSGSNNFEISVNSFSNWKGTIVIISGGIL